MKMLLRFFSLINVLLLSTCELENAEPPVKFSKLDVEEHLRKHRVQGVSIAIIEDYKVVFVKSYGVKDAVTGEPVDTNTLFQAASISKPVAALAALRQVQAGTLDLEASINEQLRSWKVPFQSSVQPNILTLKHLLSHSGGINVSGFPGYQADSAVPSLVQILLGQAPANNQPVLVVNLPGSGYHYSGGGYCIVQQAMVDQAQKPFPTIMQETLDVLGMQHSSFNQPLKPEQLPIATAGHYKDGSRIAGERYIYPELAAGGLWTTAQDLAEFVTAIQLSLKNGSDKVLQPQLAQLMVTPYISSTNGLGFFVNQKGPDVYFSHDGANVGYQCKLVAHRDKGYGAVVMTNSDNGQFITEILKSISMEYTWENYPL